MEDLLEALETIRVHGSRPLDMIAGKGYTALASGVSL
jgi:hypothetical protein